MYNLPLSGPEPVPFRRATLADMHHVWHIVYHAYAAYIPLLGRTPPTFLEDFDSHITAGNLWLLERSDGINAMCVLTPRDDHLLIQALCVDPSYQGQGLGRAMLAFAEQEARARGHAELRLYTNSKMARNIRIYREWGFRISGREGYAWGERVHMSKALAKTKTIKTPQRAVLPIAA